MPLSKFANGLSIFQILSSGAGDVATDAIWDAKGDLAVGTGADTAAKLTVGADGKYLKAASGEATGLIWDSPAGSGDVTSAAAITDHSIVRGDGGVKGVQDTGVIIDDSDNVTMPVSTSLTIGDGGETITSDNTDLTVNSGVDINLTATSDINVPANVGVTFGDDGEKIEGDGTDLTIASSAKLNLSATSDVIVPVNVGIILGDGAEKIESDNTDLTINSGAKINLTATSDVVVPVNIGIVLGDGAEKVESDNTDLTINSGVDINLTATSDINVPANIGMTFGDDGEKIEGDGTDLTITSSGKLNLNSTDALEASHQAITDNHLLTVDGTLEDNDFCYATASGVEGKTAAESIVLLLGAALPENTAIILDAALSADGKYSGIVETGTAGATLAFGDCIYQAVGDDRWELAKADAEATTKPKLGICVQAAANDGSATTILLWGKVRADTAFPAFTKYAPVFIDSATAGDLTNTAPAAVSYIRCVGQAISADELLFKPDNLWIKRAT